MFMDPYQRRPKSPVHQLKGKQVAVRFTLYMLVVFISYDISADETPGHNCTDVL